MASEQEPEYQATPVQDGLTKTAKIVAGESKKYACTITFRPATGMRTIRYDADRRVATGSQLVALMTEMVKEHVISIEDVVSGFGKGAKPRETKVLELLPILDAETVHGIVNKVIEAAWDVDTLLGN